MDTHGHETVARVGRDLMVEALKLTCREHWNLQSFYLGNWLTDVSQGVDPIAYASFKDKVVPAVKALRSVGTLLRKASRWAFGSKQTTLLGWAETFDGYAAALDGYAHALNVDADRNGRLANLLRKAMRAKGYFKFAHPEKPNRPSRMRFSIYKRVFQERFTQYYPHEHLDRFPGELDRYGGYADEVAPGTRTHDVRPGTGSAVSPHLYRFLADDIEIAAGLMAEIDRDWARPTFQPGATEQNDQNEDWNVRLAALGHALHALEDFFAHSNFVEHAIHGLSNGEAVLSKLGFENDGDGQSPRAVFDRRLKKLRGHRERTLTDRVLDRIDEQDAGDRSTWINDDSEAMFDWRDLDAEDHVVTGYFDFCDTFFSLRHVAEEVIGKGKPVEGKLTAAKTGDTATIVTLDIGASARVKPDSLFTIYRGGTIKVADAKVVVLRETEAELEVYRRYPTLLDSAVGDTALERSKDQGDRVEKGEAFVSLLRMLCLAELKAQALRGDEAADKAAIEADLQPLTRLVSGVPAAEIRVPGLDAAQVGALDSYLSETTDPRTRENALEGAKSLLALPPDAVEIRDDVFEVVAGYCERNGAGSDSLFEQTIKAMQVLEVLLDFAQFMSGTVLVGLPLPVKQAIEATITKPIGAMINNLLGRYRIGCHSLLAKDYEWDDPVLDKLYTRSRNLARAVHWHCVKVLTRWAKPNTLAVCRAPGDEAEARNNTADSRQWVDWLELFEFFLRHPHGQPQDSNLPATDEKDRWWYDIVASDSDDGWRELPGLTEGVLAAHRPVFYKKDDHGELVGCATRMRQEAEAFYDDSRQTPASPPPQHDEQQQAAPPAEPPAEPPRDQPAPAPEYREVPAAYLPDHAAVRQLQTLLKELGHDPGEIDGDWGPNTRAGLTSFQRAHPPLLVDGIFGPNTRAALDREVNGRLERAG